MITDINNIDIRLVELRKEGNSLYYIHNWLSGWENYKQLDEIIILAHILNVLSKQNLFFSRKQINRVFMRFYEKKYHGGNKTYVNWLYDLKNTPHSKRSGFCSLEKHREALQSTKMEIVSGDTAQ